MGEHRTALTVAIITGLFGVLAAVVTVVLPQWLDDEPRDAPAALLVPTPTFTAPAVLTDPTPTSTLPPLSLTPGTVLYEANAELGWSGWTAPSWHVLSDRLSNDSLSEGVWISAPYQPDRIADYAVEAEIRLSNREENCEGVVGDGEGGTLDYSYGIVARAVTRGSYSVGIRSVTCRQRASIYAGREERAPRNVDDLAVLSDTDWHTYRVEVEGTFVRLLIDGEVIVQTTDDQFTEGGQVGLWSNNLELDVRRFRVIAL
jgi:hypothetical protein